MIGLSMSMPQVMPTARGSYWEQINNALKSQMADQSIQRTQLQNQFYPELTQSQIDINKAKAKNMPLELQLRQAMYNPEYLALRNAQLRQLIEHPERFASGIGKEIIEADRLRGGGGLAPQQPSFYKNAPENTAPQPDANPKNLSAPPLMPAQQGNPYAITPESASKIPGAIQAQPVVTDAGDLIMPQYAQNNDLMAYDNNRNKKAVSNQTWKQFQAARQLEGFANSDSVRQSLSAYAQYAGLFGKGKEYIDSLKRTNPDLYNKAMEAQNITLSNLTNLERRLEDLSVDEKTRAEIRGTLDGAKSNITSNPKRSLYLINAALRQMSDITKQVYATAQPFKKIFVPHPFSPIKESEWQAPDTAAQDINMGIRPLNSFSSREEFRKYYGSLSNIQKAIVNKQLGGGK